MHAFSQLNTVFNQVENLPCYRYLLLDGLASVSEFSSISFSALCAHLPEQSIIPVLRPDLSHDVEHCPHLICLATPGEAFDSHYLYRSMKESLSEFLLPRRYVVGWLISELEPSALSEQIVRIGNEINVQPNSLFTPFYEPFRLSLINNDMLATRWLNSLLSGVLHFFYISAEGQLSDTIVEGAVQGSDFIYLSESARFYQQEARSLFYLYDSYQTLLADDNETPSPNALNQLCQYYRQAVDVGLDNLADRYIFAFYAMKRGDLLKHPITMKAINQALIEPGTLGDVLIEITEKQWSDNDDLLWDTHRSPQ